MVKENNLIRKLAHVIALVLTVTSVLGNYNVIDVAAGTTDVTSLSTETTSGETSSTSEKQLVQYSDNWTIFQYLDDAGKPTFYLEQVLYPISKVDSNKLLFQYRIIYKCNENFELNSSSWYDLDTDISSVLVIDDSWDDGFIADDSTCAYETTVSSYYNLDDTIPEETITDIENNKTNYFIQFRLVNTDNKDNTISKSYTLLIYPQDEPFPYVVSSNIDCCKIYDVTTQSTDFTITLVFNDLLFESDINDISVDLSYPISSDYLFGETYQKNLTTNLYNWNTSIGNKRYEIYRTEVSFDVKIPLYHLMNTDENSTFNCLYTINGLEGYNTLKEPDGFMFSVCVPPLADRTLVGSIDVTAPNSSLEPNTSLALTANVLPEDAEDKSVTWSSSNTDYATVDANGVVTAKAAGAGKTVTITATANDGSGVTGTCTLTILEATDIPVKEIAINAPSSTVKPGSKIALSATVAPSDATNSGVTWSSSNTAYATVDANGVVTANAAGAGKSVTITAKANDGSGVSGTYTLYIETIPVTGITIKGAATSVNAGSKITLSATVAPSNATNIGVTWSSSNTAYATVDQSGVVTTKAAGAGKTVTITATANDGSGVKSTFNLNIKKVNVTKITLSTTTKTVKAGQKATVKAAIAPSNATDKALIWTSSNTKYATVNSKGVVTTKKAGIGKTVTITAKAKDGSGKKASVKIKIVKTVTVSSIKLSASSKTVKAGKKVTVKATISPSNATNKALTWTTSNKKYATVSSKGVVTTKKAGKGKTVTITAKAKDGSGKKATFKIKIK